MGTGLEVLFTTDGPAPIRLIEGFDPDVEALEVKIQRKPGDDRPVEGTDLAWFLEDDGSHGTSITLQLGATDTAAAASTILRHSGADDIGLAKVSIKVRNPTA